ncbi:hypothetical protein Lbir_1485 [Legionella birminghamensis]|uniref:Uncharacterized protein n=2 Tax=Legionella birminghamensis TaxID=28083 RepID=A0A378IBY3_9GAMM|nr:hypothetical protein Lbir_1485 [Legionella birminghamensis]STX32533.1 Uncharacterised protein [Legionella birminghamensis]
MHNALDFVNIYQVSNRHKFWIFINIGLRRSCHVCSQYAHYVNNMISYGFFTSFKSAMKEKFNFKDHTISVYLYNDKLRFKLRNRDGQTHHSSNYHLAKWLEDNLSTFPAYSNDSQFLCRYIQHQLRQFCTSNHSKFVQVFDDRRSTEKKVVIGEPYGLLGGVTGGQILQVTCSGLQIAAAVALTPVNPWLASGVWSSGVATLTQAIQDENLSTAKYLSTGVVSASTGLLGGGANILLGQGVTAMLVGGALSKPAGRALEAVVTQQPLPSGEDLLSDVVVGGIANVVGGKTSEYTSKASGFVLGKMINPVSSALNATVSQSLTAASAATSSQITSQVTENVLLEKPLGHNLTPSSLVATALASGAAGGIQAYMQHQERRIKLIVQDEDGNERVIWSGSEQDYEDYDIAKKVEEWQGTMDLDELTERLAEETGEKSSRKRKADDDDSGRAKKAKVEPLVPPEKWDDSLTAVKLVKAERAAGGGINAIAKRMSDILACKFWGGDPANHDNAAKEAMRIQFEKDQDGSSQRHEKRLIRSASRYMEAHRIEHAAKALLVQYESQKPATIQTIKYFNEAPQKDLIVQVYIQKIDNEFKKAGYSSLDGDQKAQLTMICNEHLTKTPTDRQKEAFINAGFAIAGGNFTDDQRGAAYNIFKKAQETAVNVGERRFDGLEVQKKERVHKNRTKVLKCAVGVVEQAAKEVLRGGAGAGVQTDGQQVKLTVGPAKQPDMVPVYTSGEKGQFSQQLEDAVKKTAPTVREQAPLSLIKETVVSPPPLKHLPLPVKRPAAPVNNRNNNLPPNKVARATPATASKVERSKLPVKTETKQKEKDKKGREHWRYTGNKNKKDGQFAAAPHKQMSTSRNGLFSRPGVNLKQGDKSVGVTNSTSYVAPLDISSHVQLELTQTTSVGVAHMTSESGVPAVSATASSRLEVAKMKKARLDLFAVDLNASASDKELGLSAQVSLAQVQTVLETKPVCQKGSCTKVTVVASLHAGSAGIKAGFSNNGNNTKVSAGVGLGLFGASAQVNIEKWTENTGNTGVQSTSGLQDPLIQPRIK